MIYTKDYSRTPRQQPLNSRLEGGSGLRLFSLKRHVQTIPASAAGQAVQQGRTECTLRTHVERCELPRMCSSFSFLSFRTALKRLDYLLMNNSHEGRIRAVTGRVEERKKKRQEFFTLESSLRTWHIQTHKSIFTYVHIYRHIDMYIFTTTCTRIHTYVDTHTYIHIHPFARQSQLSHLIQVSYIHEMFRAALGWICMHSPALETATWVYIHLGVCLP